MQRQIHDTEQKSSDEKIVLSRMVSTSSSNEQDNGLSKTTRLFHSKTNRVSKYPELKLTHTLSTVPDDDSHEMLKIRSLKQHTKPAIEDDEISTIITINVSGDRYQTFLSTLQLYPDTLLGNEEKRQRYWNPKTEEYFFDRHRACFAAILYYYQSNGRLRRPDSVPLDTFLEEITFFELGSEASTQVRQSENIKEVHRKQLPRTLWRRYIWVFLEYPQYSTIARVTNLSSIFFTILSCVALAIETLPQYDNYYDNICKEQANISLNSTDIPVCSALFQSPFFIIQTICVAYFTIEFLLRIISAPSYRRFVFSFFTWVDLAAIVPYYVFLGIQLSGKDSSVIGTATLSVRILRVLRFSRILRLYTVFKQLKSLRVLSATVAESSADFIVMIIILTLLAFLFGVAIYLAEKGANGDFYDSIPKATYWGIITITGVGYGDIYPITAAGRFLACLCCLCGSTTVGMLVSVLVDRYQRVYNRRMYLPEEEVPKLKFHTVSRLTDVANSMFIVNKSSRAGTLAETQSRKLSTLSGKIKHKHHQSSLSLSSQSHPLQFVVSFNGNSNNKNNNNETSTATDHMVTVIKEKLTEVIKNSNIDVNFKMIDNDEKELWTISSANTLASSPPNRTSPSNIDIHELSKS